MRLSYSEKINNLSAKLVFLLLPTLLLCYFLIWNANQYYSILNNQALKQTFQLGVGMLGATFFFSFRFRFLPPTIILVVVLAVIYKGIDALSFGEFDTFFTSVQFLFFSLLLCAGWLTGWGFARLKYFPIFVAVAFLSACIFILSKQNELFYAANKTSGIREYALLFGPVVLYSFYIIFTSILIRNYQRAGKRLWWILVKRLFGFLLLTLLLFGGVLYLQSNQIKETLAEFGGGGAGGKNSMLKQEKDNTFDLKDYSRLSGSLGRSNELLFAAHIDHYFPDSEVPNPLYLTAFYYSKFDTLTETFEKDSLIPRSDLFEPDPAGIPLFAMQTDSSVLEDALREKFRTTIEIEVYKKQLSPHSFVAPSTSFFVQPITIEKEFRKEFKSAYRAKSYISELNSAYFVYNAPNPMMQLFQEQRFEVLRLVKNYDNIDPELKAYYTYMPDDPKFDDIRKLALEITADKSTPVDKIIAIRDYFLSADENGKPLFSYSDNPGVPDIPNASKLQYFLFENRKGYCAYYAGATLFLLRSLNIPSRITVGFMTVDRSSQNKGWYWYYADQAHAWVQVYFPGFGWLDFDTTVGNDDARESPQPDGTPPMQPPKAYLAADGVVTQVDTNRKTVDVELVRMMYHDLENHIQPPVALALDVQRAAIIRDSSEVSLNELKAGDSVTAVSYATVFKNLTPRPGEAISALINRFPLPAPVDEIHIKKRIEKEQAGIRKQARQDQPTNWPALLLAAGCSIAILLLLLLFFPLLVFNYLKIRYRLSKTVAQKSYYAYHTTGFYLNQLGFMKGEETSLQHAQKVDTILNTNIAGFMVPYLKLKYADQALTEAEERALTRFLPGFLKQVRRHIPFKQRVKKWFHVYRGMSYF